LTKLNKNKDEMCDLTFFLIMYLAFMHTNKNVVG